MFGFVCLWVVLVLFVYWGFCLFGVCFVLIFSTRNLNTLNTCSPSFSKFLSHLLEFNLCPLKTIPHKTNPTLFGTSRHICRHLTFQTAYAVLLTRMIWKQSCKLLSYLEAYENKTKSFSQKHSAVPSTKEHLAAYGWIKHSIVLHKHFCR